MHVFARPTWLRASARGFPGAPRVMPARGKISPDGTAYDLEGPADAPVLAFIHGLGLCRQVWRGLLPAFADYHILNYDLYGHGDSAPSTDTASLAVYSRQLLRLMDHLNLQRVSVVGFSIGGMINRRFALDHGDRLDRLVILNAPHDRGKEAQAQVEDRAAAARDQGASATLEEALKRWFTPEFLATQPDAADLVRRWRRRADRESYAQAAWVLANGVRELVGHDLAVSSPTLVMTCEHDSGSTPEMAQSITAQISGARCLIVPRLKHLGLMEDADAFTSPMVEFLR